MNSIEHLQEVERLVIFYINSINNKRNAISDVYNLEKLEVDLIEMETTLKTLNRIKISLIEDSIKTKAIQDKINAVYVVSPHEHLMDRMNRTV